MKMQKKLHYILRILLILTLALSLAACQNESREAVLSEPPWRGEAFSFGTGARTNMIGGQNYAAGSFLSVLEKNRLSFQTVVSSHDGEERYENAYYAYEQIVGLKSNYIQEKINRRIMEPALEWCEKRPRITDELYAEQSDRARENAFYGVSADFSWSCCDYLSGIMTRSIDYYDPESRTHSVYKHVAPLNFDLRTGEEFDMAALFAYDYDYLAIISDEVLQYAVTNGLTLKGFNKFKEDLPFCLSRDGLVVFLDGRYASQGLAENTPVTIAFDAFGDNWAIERPCENIYEDEENRAYIMLRQSSLTMLSTEKVYYDEGENLSIRTVSSLPESFPAELTEDAEAFIDIYLPSANDVNRARYKEGEYLRQLFEISGERIGYMLCIKLNASIKKGGEIPWSATRYYVYNENGVEITLPKAFVQGFDYASLISSLIQRALDACAEEGWVSESEVGTENLDFLPDTEGIYFATLPVRMTRTVTAVDGSESVEIRNESLLLYATYEEIGFENLLLFEP
ncbi:MAG TPA: hypothetical protein PL035_03345 [Bacillota bacterium]|nr:hypothetical protein [Bacillota bacterium]